MQIRAGDDIAPAMAAGHCSYLLILSKHVLLCPVLGAVVIDTGLTSDTLPSNPAKCLSSDGRRAEDASFPKVLTGWLQQEPDLASVACCVRTPGCEL